jgi:hypothetical protein
VWISEHYGAHRATVGRLIREYGLVKPATGPGVAAQIDPDELYRMHNVERLPAEEIGQRLGVATATAYLWMRRYGVPRRARTRRQAAAAPPLAPWISQASLVTLWEEGWSGARIAEATGLDPDVVKRRLAAAGLLAKRPTTAAIPVGDPDDPLPKALLERLYLEQHLSPWDIAKLTGTTARQVDYRLTRYSVPRRQPGEHVLIRDLDPETLRELYRGQERSDPDIAALYQVSEGHVSSTRRHHGIESRPGAQRTSAGRTPLSKEVLERLHVKGGMTAEQIAVELGYLSPTGEPSLGRVRHALERHGLSIPHEQRVIDPRELRRLYQEERLDEAAIGERLGWRTPHGKPSVVHIRKLLVEAGVARRRADGAPNPDTADLLRLHREEHMCAEQIAEHVGWFDERGRPAALQVRRRLRRAGMPGLTVRRFPTTGQDRAVELYDEKGMTLREVAEHLGWYSASGTPQVAAVQKALRDAGVPTRPSGPQPRARKHG